MNRRALGTAPPFAEIRDHLALVLSSRTIPKLGREFVSHCHFARVILKDFHQVSRSTGPEWTETDISNGCR